MLTKDQLFVLVEGPNMAAHRELTDDEVAAFNALPIPDASDVIHTGGVGGNDHTVIYPWLESIGITGKGPRIAMLCTRLGESFRRSRARAAKGKR